jgi:polyisoprenoid-binding protein YceI
VQTGPQRFRVDGLFTIRGATKPEELKLTLSRHGTGTIRGTKVFHSKEYRMNSGIASIQVVNRIFQGFSRHA